MVVSQADKAQRFRALHERPGGFVIPNPWDSGTARMLAGLGYEALATTSGGFAITLGKRDGEGAVTRAEVLAHARALVQSTDLPVSADMENGYGDEPESVAETVRLAASVGLVGCSIEDATGDPHRPIYARSHAVERITAAVEAARSLPFAFTLTARAENFLRGNRISMTPSSVFRHSPPPERMCSTRRACLTWLPFGPCAHRCLVRST